MGFGFLGRGCCFRGPLILLSFPFSLDKLWVSVGCLGHIYQWARLQWSRFSRGWLTGFRRLSRHLNPGEMGVGEIVGLLRDEYSTIYTATRSPCKWRNYKLLRRSLYNCKLFLHTDFIGGFKQSNGFYVLSSFFSLS